MADNRRVTYKNNTSAQDASKIIKAVAYPAIIMFVGLGIISMFGDFGKNLIAPLVGLMWIVGDLCAFLLPSHRNTVIKETLTTIGCYVLGLAAFRALLILISGVSTQQLMASIDQTIPLTYNNNISSFLQTALMITAVMTPIGFFGMQFKRLLTFRNKVSQAKIFDQLRSIRNSNQPPTR